MVCSNGTILSAAERRGTESAVGRVTERVQRHIRQ